MEAPEQVTCWTLIRAVQRGEDQARSDFVIRYRPVVLTYLRARWKNRGMAAETEDAVNEVFLRCFTAEGPLDRVDPVARGGFRAYLYGITRHVARETERERWGAGAEVRELHEIAAQEQRLSTLFDRAFSRAIMREARLLLEARARTGTEDERWRLQVLVERFEQDLPVRTIAERHGKDPARVHKDYARARREFRQALLDVIAEQNPSHSSAQVEELAKEIAGLLR